MSYPWDPPQGDVGGLQAAGKALGRLATDLYAQISRARAASAEAKSEWHAPRADDFANAAQALVDELGMAATAIGNTANLVGQWATAVQTATTNIASWKAKYDVVANPKPGTPVDSTSMAREETYYWQQACTEHTNLKTYASRIASAIDQEVDLAVPKSAGLSPSEISRRVDASLGMDNFTRGEFYDGAIDDTAIWNMLHTADGPVYDAGVPVPGDPTFQAWYAALTPAQQLLETQKLTTSFDPGQGFNPYTHVQGGSMPQWAQTFNDEHQNSCGVDGKIGDGYGYFGGGTILGPGGKQWPIVMPYFNDGKATYMDDGGQTRADGGIDQLDGKDPGWHTVTTWEGGGDFGSISGGTRLATMFLIASGQDLEVNQVDPGAVAVGPDGKPYAGHDVTETPGGPPDKEWWDVTSSTAFPENVESSDPRVPGMQPNLEWQEPALGANALLVQGGQALAANAELSQHAKRAWYVDYQVNDDGRVRAVVRTFTAGKNDDDKTVVDSFANTFPTGQSGNTNEVPYKTRFNPYSQPVATAAPDPDVIYSNQSPDEPSDRQGTAGYIPEKLNK